MSKASVAISGKIFSSIDQGLVLLVGISQADGPKDIEYLVNKITNMRLFPNDNGNNESAADIIPDIFRNALLFNMMCSPFISVNTSGRS